MVRFDDYKPREREAERLRRGQDRLRGRDPLDPGARTRPRRVAQVESGELDFADDLSPTPTTGSRPTRNVQPIIVKPYYWLVAVFNKKEGLMTNQKLRQAWQAALDIEPIMKTVAGGKSEFYRMDSSLAFQELPPGTRRSPGCPGTSATRTRPSGSSRRPATRASRSAS